VTSKVLLIAGVGKSGSTLIGALLGQLPRYRNAGEVISIEHAGREGHRCGCGNKIGSCEFWGPIVEESIGGIDCLDMSEWGRLHTGRFFSSGGIGAGSSKGREFIQLQALYRALLARKGSSVIVDGSKSFRYARALGAIPDLEAFVLHLVRDPRAIEHSKSRLLSDGHWKFNTTSTLYNSIQWLGLNLLLESLVWDRRYAYRRIRYEDFIQSPAENIADITEWVTGDREHPEIDSDGGVTLGPNHTLGGSDVRLESGRVVLSGRDGWKEQLSKPKKLAVTLITLPLLYRYRYPLVMNTKIGSNKTA
jgi:hypothetical protein